MGYEVPGQLAVWLALFTNILAGFSFFMVARGKVTFVSLAHRSYHLFTLLITLAVAYLFYLFFSHNYAFKYVYEYCERSQPFFYVLSGFWGGQEGTYLLWLFLAALFGYIIIRRGGRYKNHAMAIYSLANLFFLFLLVKLSPFALLPMAAADGLGLNHLLRDPWMVIHPPVIFLGYAMAGVPFALALAALWQNDYFDWVKRVFPWVAICALMLGAGNILGGYWAYKTLGWGGFWAWDPVENSSLVPWLISLALLHGLIIERRRGSLRRANLLLTAFVFLLVVYGTFLTRSGVLSDFSVHSFVDLGINVYLIGFLVLFLVLTLALIIPRWNRIKAAPLEFNYFGREFSTFVAMAVLFIFGLVVLFWSSLPILTSAFASEPRAAEIATYNSFALPLAIIMAFLLTISPFLTYAGFRPNRAVLKVLLAFSVSAAFGFGLFHYVLSADRMFATLFTLVVGGMLVYFFKSDLRKKLVPALVVLHVTIAVTVLLGVRDYVYVLFFAMAATAATSNIISLVGFLPGRWRLMGAHVTHFGFGLMLIGVLASSAYDSSEQLVIPRGDTVTADLFGLSVSYQGMEHDLEHPDNELRLAVDDGSDEKNINPQLYYSARMDGMMRRPFIDRSLFYDLYFAPQQVQALEQQDALVLKKGESKQIEDLTLSFSGFEMGGHDQSDGADMMVSAKVEVEREGEALNILPALVHTEDAYGRPFVQTEPARFTIGEQELGLVLTRVFADQGAVELRVVGLHAETPVDRLIIDISRKPAIVLVWVGTTFILLGSLIVYFRRRQELYMKHA